MIVLSQRLGWLGVLRLTAGRRIKYVGSLFFVIGLLGMIVGLPLMIIVTVLEAVAPHQTGDGWSSRLIDGLIPAVTVCVYAYIITVQLARFYVDATTPREETPAE